MAIKTSFVGRCPRCGRTYYSRRKETVVCDCWRYCPVCGAEMQPYTPDLTPNVYAKDGKHDLEVLMVCNNHSPPFFSTQKPVEVACE